MSIRSDRGSASHDCVLRLFPVSDTPDEAPRFAAARSLERLGAAATRSNPQSNKQE